MDTEVWQCCKTIAPQILRGKEEDKLDDRYIYGYVEYNYVHPHSYNGYATPHEARIAA